MRAHRIEVVRWRCSGFTMLHPLRPPLIGLYPGHPHPLLASLSHGDFRDWENEKSYAIKFIITEDALSSNAPHIETLHDSGCHYILGVKQGDHTYLFQQVQAAEAAGRVAYYVRHDRAAGLVHRFRFVNDMPLNGSRTDVRVNFIEYWEVSQDQVQHFSWVTDLRVSKRNVYTLMRGGRARWKIENETFNTLKNQGYNFE